MLRDHAPRADSLLTETVELPVEAPHLPAQVRVSVRKIWVALAESCPWVGVFRARNGVVFDAHDDSFEKLVPNVAQGRADKAAAAEFFRERLEAP
jgi:hypothetical protein